MATRWGPLVRYPQKICSDSDDWPFSAPIRWHDQRWLLPRRGLAGIAGSPVWTRRVFLAFADSTGSIRRSEINEFSLKRPLACWSSWAEDSDRLVTLLHWNRTLGETNWSVYVFIHHPIGWRSTIASGPHFNQSPWTTSRRCYVAFCTSHWVGHSQKRPYPVVKRLPSFHPLFLRHV